MRLAEDFDQQATNTLASSFGRDREPQDVGDSIGAQANGHDSDRLLGCATHGQDDDRSRPQQLPPLSDAQTTVTVTAVVEGSERGGFGVGREPEAQDGVSGGGHG